ncbi:cell wall-binding repeat-containing protein [Agilicoccus flavus]|uniref:cell wall-binding repeat-containing protein n=1 Tax=Agilicoccus flavus TaxID=2775968 RepID=UPI001CF6A246|nr:cell wall-binding repeat-containing protein [Agilicoccus flavus]
MRTSRRITVGAAAAALVATGLTTTPAAEAASGVEVIWGPSAAPVAGDDFAVTATGLAPNEFYTAALTPIDAPGGGADAAEANSCRAPRTDGGSTPLTCTLEEDTAGRYVVELRDAVAAVVARTEVTVVAAASAPSGAPPPTALPAAVDMGGTGNDVIRLERLPGVTWRVAGVAVTFADGETRRFVDAWTLGAAAGAVKAQALTWRDVEVVGDAAPGTTFPDGSTTWRKAYRFTPDNPAPAFLDDPATPVRRDEPGRLQDTLTLTRSADYSWRVAGAPVTFESGRDTATVPVSPEADGAVRVVAVAADGRAFVGGSPHFEFTFRFDGPPASVRLAGADRFSTAVAVSRQAFPGPVERVTLASGVTFPDALAAGPAAARAGGPLLLSGTRSLRADVLAEVARLRPKRITVVGGTGAVDATVETALAKIAPVSRVAGADRWATAARVADTWSGSPTVYLAAGTAFPDALSAGSGAAAENAPLLLTDDRSITPATAAALARTSAKRVVIVGGPAVVGDSVAQQVRELLPGASVTRLAGADRYATSAAVVAAVTGRSGTATSVYVASGGAFPDALVGVPASAAAKAPLVLTSGECLSPAVVSALTPLPLSRVVRIGGRPVVGDIDPTTVCR